MDLNKTSAQVEPHRSEAETPDSPLTPVNQMFNGRSVFITGASGFIGRVLLEKLLRCYAGIKNIYILMRAKRNQHPYDRLHKQLLQVPIFDKIRSMKNGDELLDKIVVISGDIALPRLGISDQDMARMLADESLSIVFHSAATIKFDEPIRQSVQLNLVATKEIVNLCRQLTNLTALVHVSTAYVNSDILDQSIIEEKLYPIKEKPQDLIKLSELMDENLMQELKLKLVDQRPNTYTYTKALAEHFITEEAADLPVIIVRPSIVTGAWKEPLPGWVDNLNGPTGLLLAVGKGLLRSLWAVRSVVAEIIPVDVVVNTMIASAYYTAKLHNKLDSATHAGRIKSPDTGTRMMKTRMSTVEEDEIENEPIIKSNPVQTTTTTTNTTRDETLLSPIITNGKISTTSSKEGDTHQQPACNGANGLANGVETKTTNYLDRAKDKEELPPIVHCTSGAIKPLRWGDMEDMFSIVRKYPSCQVLRYPFGTFKSNKYADVVARIFAHYLPALIIDMICGLLGKKRQLLSVYNKLHSATAALSHFATNNYNFKVGNIRQVEAALTSDRDRRELYMEIGDIEWTEYFDNYVLGARRYVLKEPDENLTEARKSFKRAYYIEISLRVLLGAIVCTLLMPYITQLANIYPIRGVLQTLKSGVA